jgi:hypothetical protein
MGRVNWRFSVRLMDECMCVGEKEVGEKCVLYIVRTDDWMGDCSVAVERLDD